MSKVTKIVASVSKNQLDEREKFANKEKQEWEFELFICIVCTMLCTNMYNDFVICSHRIICMMNELLKKMSAGFVFKVMIYNVYYKSMITSFS